MTPAGATSSWPRPRLDPRGRHDASGAARLEYRDGERRAVIDAFLDDRHYVVPPSENSAAFLLIDRET